MFMLCNNFRPLSRYTFEIRAPPPADFKHLQTLPVIGLKEEEENWIIESCFVLRKEL